jgi:hypothetical protein
MIENIRRRATLFAIAFWLGGLTFYSLIVVPTGTEVVGRLEQGFITRAVTAKLNWIGAATLGILLWDVIVAKRRMLAATWVTLIVFQLALVLLHPRLESLLDMQAHDVTDHAKFYSIHRVYLWLVAGQWLAGVWHFWLVGFTPHVRQATS